MRFRLVQLGWWLLAIIRTSDDSVSVKRKGIVKTKGRKK
jgi:hypothetical protein